MPASRTALNISVEAASSASPPKDIVPKHSCETRTPVRPRRRCFTPRMLSRVLDRSQAARWRRSPIIRFPMKTKTRPIPKGRAVDAAALAEVQRLLGDAPRQRDLLIEHLHKLNDHFGYLPAAHLAALAQDMKMALAEVYEVATFYHHFEVVKEGEIA